MRKNLLTLWAFSLAFVSASAQTDVTSTYLQNAGFDEESIWVTTTGFAKTAGAWSIVGSPANGSSGAVGYANNTTMNSVSCGTNPEGTTDGGALNLSIGWGGSVQYTQGVTLPTGFYKLGYKAYNANTSASSVSKNLIGFIPSDGNAAYANTTDFGTTTWTDELSTVIPGGEGKVSVGFTSFSGSGSGSAAKLFIDYVKLYQYDLSTFSTDNTLDVTSVVAENNFEGGSHKAWTCTTKAQNQAIATNRAADEVANAESAFTSHFLENWNPSAFTGKIYQDVKNLPGGLYKVEIAAFVNTLASDNETAVSQYVYFNDVKVPLTTDINRVYSGTALVTDGTLSIGLAQDVATANWMGIDNVKLSYCGPAIGSEAIDLPSEGNVVADTWYKYTVTVAGEYAIKASDASSVVYTSNGSQPLTSYSAETCSETLTLEVGTYYFKSSSEQALSIAPNQMDYTVGEATITPADGSYLSSLTTVTITFPNAITNDETATFAILNEDGVTCGDKVATLSLDGTTLTATFSDLTLDLNQEVTVSIAEGTVGYQGNTSNAAVSVTYKNGNIAEGTYYLYDTTTKTFIGRGQDYNAAAVAGYGLPAVLTLQSDGTYTVTFETYFGSSATLYDDNRGDAWLFADATRNNHWTFVASGEGYLIKNANSTKYNGKYVSVATDGLHLISGDVESVWKLVSSEERKALIAAAEEAQTVATAKTAGLTVASTTELETTLEDLYEATTETIVESVAEAFQKLTKDAPVTLISESVTTGLYKVHADIMYRPSSYSTSTCKDAFDVWMQATAGDNTSKMQVGSPFDKASVTSPTAWTENGPADVEYDGYYYPNNTGSFAASAKAGNYGYDLYIYVAADGNLTVTVNNNLRDVMTDSWLVYQNVTLTKYAEPTLTITKDGLSQDESEYYATYVTTKTVDLSKCDFTAYSVTTSGTTLYYNKETGIVPAGTPLVVAGSEAKTYDVIVSTEESSEVVSNDLKVADGTTTGDGSTIYILAKGGSGLGWYLCTEGTTINKDKCYLIIENAAGAKFIGIDGLANGISSVTTEQSNSQDRYNLSGQRVDNSYKGIVIENGKKYLLK